MFEVESDVIVEVVRYLHDDDDDDDDDVSDAFLQCSVLCSSCLSSSTGRCVPLISTVVCTRQSESMLRVCGGDSF